MNEQINSGHLIHNGTCSLNLILACVLHAPKDGPKTERTPKKYCCDSVGQLGPQTNAPRLFC